ncbi:AAA family ATPase [Pseudomonas mosselii]|uniref:ATP-dependent nuclease n=1 Tax=Pseudomonas mosselii TaxID=78327 RepID=UPI0018D862D3|nr:AAA family ATPase [Pseudomonas mosselii]MBH3311383.1 AAA family ATPase [Pseudomonas mosselii]MBH3326969.1 AAA family ATPase [Pseudomonas mosselii]
MKKAAIQDCWDKLDGIHKAARGVVAIRQLTPHLPALEFKPGGIFAVVGANGAGKSSFFSYLTDANFGRISFHNHEIELHGGTTISIPGGTVSATLSEPLTELRESNYILNQFISTFGQDGIAPLQPKELSLINYVLGSSYDSISIEEIAVGDDKHLPRFVFEKGGLTHDNLTASMGEQLVMFIYWSLTKKHRGPGIFFLEEPETGLTPAAQERIVDLLAFISADRSKQIFISTHSPFIVSKLGAERVIVMKRPQTALWSLASSGSYLSELGVAPVTRGVFFLEDNKAKVFFEKLLDLYGSQIRKSHEIVYLGGHSNVYEVVYRYAQQKRGLAIKGIIDADQRGDVKYHTDAFAYLPGELEPENELLRIVQAHPLEFAKKLGVRKDRLQDAIRLCQGFEKHDKFEEISRVLYGKVDSNVYQTAFLLWFEKYPVRQKIHDFMLTIDSDLTADDIEIVDSTYAD